MHFVINGQPRELELLSETSTVADVIQALALKGDRVAIEQNGEIVSRSAWAATPVAEGDRFEIVHFVGGGLPG
jgi:thiamine biosynthesis protein ThiS